MKSQFTVTFDGFSEKYADSLRLMLESDIDTYPMRMSMTSATVEPVEKRTVKDAAVKRLKLFKGKKNG